MRWLENILRSFLKRRMRSKMDRFYAERADPYQFKTSPFNAARMPVMEAAVSDRRWKRALELAASQGDFTRLLLPLADRVTAVEISEVASARARQALGGAPNLEWVCEDLRSWEPEGTFDLIVLADVLYYLEKPLGRAEFERQFARVHSWLAPGGRLLLVNGFLGEEERARRIGYRERFERLGLRPTSEKVVSIDPKVEPVRCFVWTLEKPA
jgi:SAM-dependent methyltransferase